VRIKSLHCKNFRAYENVKYEFGDTVRISGDNGRGKSSIAEAIVFALWGTTLTGSPYTDHLIRKGEKQAEVTVTFDFDGSDYEVNRIKGKKAEVFVDGQKAAQTDIDRILGDKQHFLSVFAPGYFASLADKDARELLMGLIKPPTQEQVLAEMDKPSVDALTGENLRDPEALAKEWRADIKANETECAKTEGRIEELQSRVGREIPENRLWSHKELDGLKAQLQSGVSTLTQELGALRAEPQSLRTRYDSLKRQLKNPPQAPYGEGDACPVCARELDSDALGHALTAHLKELNSIKEFNERVKAEMGAVIARGADVKDRVAELEASATGDDHSELRARIAELEREFAEVQTHNGIATRIRMEVVDDRAALEKAQAYIASLQAEQFKFREKIKAIGAYRAQLADMQIAQLKRELKLVDIKLFDVTKTTGEIKAVFELLYQGKPYKSLSYSEQIRVGLEIASLFNIVTGAGYPVFVDNAESITSFDEPATIQLFTAHVVEGQELQVENFETKEDAA